MQEDLLNLIKRSIVYAGELAVVETAGGTANYLEKLNQYIRYVTRSGEQVSVQDEIHVLHCFAELQKPHHILEINSSGKTLDRFITRCSIIDFVVGCYRENWEHCAANIPFQIQIEYNFSKIRVSFEASDVKSQPVIIRKDIQTVF